MADKLVVDCTTGEERPEALTAEEQAQRDADAAKAEQDAQTATVHSTNTSTLHTRLSAALAALRSFVDAPKPATAAAQASAAYDASRLACRVLVGLIRLRLGRLEATE